nr:DUF559 domain-containing protein [Pelagibacterium luteolum]
MKTRQPLDTAATSAHPSPPAPLPQGEREAILVGAGAQSAEAGEIISTDVAASVPSPLEGEGGLSLSERSDEGCAAPLKPAGADWRHETPRRNRGFAKSMRKNPTEIERAMWGVLKDRRLAAYKFRRQVPIGPYIADFVCYAGRLIIELDGSQHADNGQDAARDEWLAGKGFAVLRVRNDQLISNRDDVLDTVWHRLEERKDG